MDTQNYDGDVVARTTEAPASKTIQQTMMAVMRAVTVVQKDGTNTNQNYKFRGIDGVINAVGPAFREHGLMVLPTVTNREVERGSTARGGGMVSVRLTVRHTWMNEDGDSLDTLVEAEANDTADKATAKAMSVALRTAILQVLALPTQERDPDMDHIERGSEQQHAAREALPTKEQVDDAANRLDVQALEAMEKAAIDAGDAAARTYIGQAKMWARKALREQQAEQQQQAQPDPQQTTDQATKAGE